MTHAASLVQVIAHTRAQNRPNTHQAILLAEIDRLTAENAELRALCGAAPTS